MGIYFSVGINFFITILVMGLGERYTHVILSLGLPEVLSSTTLCDGVVE